MKLKCVGETVTKKFRKTRRNRVSSNSIDMFGRKVWDKVDYQVWFHTKSKIGNPIVRKLYEMC